MTFAEKVEKIVDLFRHGNRLEDVLIAGLHNGWSRTDVEHVVAANGWKLTVGGRLPSADRKTTLPPVVKRAASRAATGAPVERPMTVTEVALDLRVSKQTVYRLVERGQLGVIRVGRSFRIPVEAYEKYLASAYQEAS